MSLDTKIAQIRKQFLHAIENAKTSKDVEEIKVQYLGKKGFVQDLMSFLKEATHEQRPLFGKQINDLKQEIATYLESISSKLFDKEQDLKIKSEDIDITLPGKREYWGRYHPVSSIMHQMIDVLISMGFSVEEGPDVDSDFYNF